MSDQSTAVRQTDRQIFNRQPLIGCGSEADGVGWRSGNRALKAGQTIDGRGPFRQPGIDIDDPAERPLNAAKSACGLHQAAQLNVACEIARCRHNEGKDIGDLGITDREEREFLLARHDAPPIAHQSPKTASQFLGFTNFAAI